MNAGTPRRALSCRSPRRGDMGAPTAFFWRLSEKDYDFLVARGSKRGRQQVPTHQTPRTAIAAMIYVIKE